MKYGRKKNRVRVERERGAPVWLLICAAVPGWVFLFCCRGLMSRRIWTPSTPNFVFEAGEFDTAHGVSPQMFINIQCGLQRIVLFLLRTFRQRPVKMPNQLS